MRISNKSAIIVVVVCIAIFVLIGIWIIKNYKKVEVKEKNQQEDKNISSAIDDYVGDRYENSNSITNSINENNSVNTIDDKTTKQIITTNPNIINATN